MDKNNISVTSSNTEVSNIKLPKVTDLSVIVNPIIDIKKKDEFNLLAEGIIHNPHSVKSYNQDLSVNVTSNNLNHDEHFSVSPTFSQTDCFTINTNTFKQNDIQISILGKLEQNEYIFDEEKGKNVDIKVITTPQELLKTISTNSINLNGITYTLTVTDPYIQEQQDRLNHSEDLKLNELQVKEKLKNKKIEEEKDYEKKLKFKIQEILAELRDYENKAAHQVKNLLQELTKKLQERIEEYKLVLELINEPDFCKRKNNKNNSNKFAIFEDKNENNYKMFESDLEESTDNGLNSDKIQKLINKKGKVSFTLPA